jgi:hypothetical protein
MPDGGSQGADGSGVESGSTGTTGQSALTTGQGGSTRPTPGTSSTFGPGTSAGEGRLTTPVQIGIGVVKEAESGAQFGVNVTIGDTKAQAQVVIDYINSHGGLDGRKIEPVYNVTDTSDTTTPVATKEQAACGNYTQDHHVLAVVGATGATTDTLLPCLRKAGIPFVASNGATIYDDRTFREFPNLVSPSMFGGTSMFRTLIRDLNARGWFEKWGSFPEVKVGVIYHEKFAPMKRLLDEVVKPELARIGHPVVAEFGTAADTQQTVADIQNASLQFKNKGISHVLFVESGGGNPLFFMNDSESQLYRPRYALHSHDAPAAFLEGKVVPAQLNGMMGIGWLPTLDVNGTHDDVSAKLPGYKRCEELMRKGGVDMSSRTTAYAAGQFCDTIFFLVNMAVQSSGWTGKGLMAQIDGIGTSFQPTLTFATKFGKGTRAGASSYRRLAFDQGCGCFVYAGKPLSVD